MWPVQVTPRNSEDWSSTLVDLDSLSPARHLAWEDADIPVVMLGDRDVPSPGGAAYAPEAAAPGVDAYLDHHIVVQVVQHTSFAGLEDASRFTLGQSVLPLAPALRAEGQRWEFSVRLRKYGRSAGTLSGTMEIKIL